ncbi:hypothetical protein KW5_0114780 [Xanthomonas vasicola pv. vasculorum NCPPB 1326]|nr:hypothetical protein KW5_0114780 [Xanthomonas vasicola pv. vasculorum NCPPB 1326]KFA30162.1 hypothetical protein KWG_0113680 [Xanthomonas vasicola pv. vasculorum NCPPB 1381]
MWVVGWHPVCALHIGASCGGESVLLFLGFSFFQAVEGFRFDLMQLSVIGVSVERRACASGTASSRTQPRRKTGTHGFSYAVGQVLGQLIEHRCGRGGCGRPQCALHTSTQ